MLGLNKISGGKLSIIQQSRTIIIIENSNQHRPSETLQSRCSTTDFLTKKLETAVAKFSDYSNRKCYYNGAQFQNYSTVGTTCC